MSCDVTIFCSAHAIYAIPGDGGLEARGYFQRNWVGLCGTPSEALTLFQTKICDFPYPSSDLVKNLIAYFRPAL